MSQTTDTVMMITPYYFSFNFETFESNEFQNKTTKTQDQVKKEAFEEYQASVKLLKDSGVNVLSLEYKNETPVPDAVFCNNWISTTTDGSIIVYPMFNDIRKAETKQLSSVQNLLSKHKIKNIIQLGPNYEKEALEGTGSMVIDHVKKVIYAVKSPRTQYSQLLNLKESVKYYSDFEIMYFEAKSALSGKDYYHTNIVMAIGTNFAVVCTSSITKGKEDVLSKLKGKDIIDISFEQTEKYFCGNLIEVKNTKGEPVIVMSERAYSGFTSEQKKILEKHGKVVRFPLDTIEHIGGGSARCMIAEIFLPKLSQ